MSEEEMQRQMEFIVNQQAQFAADIQRAKEEREADAKLWQQKYSSLTDAMTFVVGTLGKLAEAQARAAAEIAELRKQTESRFAELAATHAETDERLNIFINVVERYISERRNGKDEDTPDKKTDEPPRS